MTTSTIWTTAMLARLRRGLANGERRGGIAADLGITPEAVHSKTRALIRAGRLGVVRRKLCPRCDARFAPASPQDRCCARCLAAGHVRPRTCASCGGPCGKSAARCGACHHAGARDAGEAGVVVAARAGEPTATLPGTPGKVSVMAERYLAGQFLFHERDAKRGG